MLRPSNWPGHSHWPSGTPEADDTSMRQQYGDSILTAQCAPKAQLGLGRIAQGKPRLGNLSQALGQERG